MSWGLWGIGVPDEPWYRTAARAPFNPLDNHYFPDYDYGSGVDGEIDDDEADQVDMGNAWLIGEGSDRRKPHLQRGVKYGPSHPDDPGTDTEKWLQNVGHEFTKRIHAAEPSDSHLYRGMAVPPEWIDKVRQDGSVSLPLSSFSPFADLAYDYSRPDPTRGWAPRRGNSVILKVEPGSKSVSLADDENVTHGDFDVLGVHDMTDEEVHNEYESDPEHTPTTVVHLRQRSVPTPAQPRTAHRTAMPMIAQRTAACGFQKGETPYAGGHRAEAFDADTGEVIGYLEHDRDSGEVSSIWVHPDHRGRGIATDLFDWTRKYVNSRLRHSDDLTDEGRAWAESMGHDTGNARTVQWPTAHRTAANRDPLRDADGRILLHRAVGPDAWGLDDGENFGQWWGSESDVRDGYGLKDESTHVAAWFSPHDVESAEPVSEGWVVRPGAVGEVLYAQNRKNGRWVPHSTVGKGHRITAHRLAMPAVDAYDNDPQYDDDYNPIPGTQQFPDEHRHLDQEIQPGPYYHATDQEFNPGDVVQSHSALHGHQGDRGNHADWVWMAKDHDTALGQAGPHLYEVEPMDEGPWEWNHDIFSHPGDDGRYVSPRARVVRKVEHDYPYWANHNKEARTMTAAVTVYTQPNCVQCTMTKKQLDKLGIEHSTVDVSADPEAHAYVTGLGYTAAPVVVVNNGESHWAGFRPERLKALSGE